MFFLTQGDLSIHSSIKRCYRKNTFTQHSIAHCAFNMQFKHLLLLQNQILNGCKK